ncbi:hypothetical protein CC86DRAFT_187285 [Ophiobolus disseminans]|uniref:Uncharacterized protein n=1 Tax=Ophiobolus disseminans TaxID=1469910 RepID=A0A6A7A7H9_9PLEO|nr:hypothetical protein CC86DRAFT_187285 [Ophiobolus disseminans]
MARLCSSFCCSCLDDCRSICSSDHQRSRCREQGPPTDSSRLTVHTSWGSVGRCNQYLYSRTGWSCRYDVSMCLYSV